MAIIYAYLLKMFFCSGLLLAYYYIGLRNKAFHNYNRFYILAAFFLSVTLPLMQFNVFTVGNNIAPLTFNYYQQQIIPASKINFKAAATNYFTWQNVLITCYLLFILWGVFKISHTLVLILKLQKNNAIFFINKVKLIMCNNAYTPFSFLNTIYWNKQIAINKQEGQMILQHELAHIQEKHTYDKFFVNFIIILFGFNPFFLVFKKELFLIHEFIADAKSGAQQNKAIWASAMLQAAYPAKYAPIFNSFFYSPIKRRLNMLSKINNPAKNYAVRIASFVVVIIAGFIISVQAEKVATQVNNINKSINSFEAALAKNIIDTVPTTPTIEKVIVTGVGIKKNNINTVKVLLANLSSANNTFNGTNNLFFIDNVLSTKAVIDSLNPTNISRINIEKKTTPPQIYIYTKKFDALNNNANNQFATPHIVEIEDTTDNLIVKTDKLKYSYIRPGNNTPHKEAIQIYGNVVIEENEFNGNLAKSTITCDSAVINSVGTANLPPTKLNLYRRNGTYKQKFEDLYLILDGKELLNTTELAAINPGNIETVNVLKGKEAEALYGEKGKKGVIIITTTKKPVIAPN